MKFDIIERLKKAPPKKRARIITNMQKKNLQFFRTRFPDVGNVVDKVGGQFEIQITPDFLNIIDHKVEKYCHPHNQLLKYIERVGSYHHTGWVDKLSMLHRMYRGGEHGEKVTQFVGKLQEKVPETFQQALTGTVTLPRLKDGRRFSGVTVFLGIFTGLPMLHYLNTAQVQDAVFIEPDVEKFGLSCFFVDYAEIEKYFGRLVLHIGENMPEHLPDLLLNKANVTSAAWLRFLPAYPSEAFENYIARFELRWRALTEIFVPYDREVRNLTYGAKNIKAKYPITCHPPKLSDNSRMAIVASGPSLENDIEWLKAHQDRLIILAAHSAMKTLNKHGIRPDYQCSLDTELQRDLIEKLELRQDVPFICYYKASLDSVHDFEKVLLYNEAGKANSVRFNRALTHTHPTTGNTATSLVVFSRPQQVFLVGLDLGFQDPDQDHVKDYWANQEEGKNKGSGVPVRTHANFAESEGNVWTYAYYNSARAAVEGGLSRIQDKKVYNLADGAKIKGAEPCRSDTLDLPPYPEKEADLIAFEKSFSTEQTDFWQPYEHTGQTLLDDMRDTVKEMMTLKRFTWATFIIALDSCWTKVVQSCVHREQGDIRVEAYSKLIHDLLVSWYRIAVFAKTPSKTVDAYQHGLTALLEVLDTVEWPEELDEWEQNEEDSKD